MAGRPTDASKDPNRRRVKNHNGRLIDFEGILYNKLINNGYKLNRRGTKLIENPNFTPVERRGRPTGTTKDPNRRRVKNHNGRLIDFEGILYNKLINNGYKLNRRGTKLIENPNFTPVERRGRPKKYPDVSTTHEKVKNPETGREIKTNTLNFRKLAKKYGYSKSRNKFLMHVPDSNNRNKSIIKNDEKFDSYLERGYVYNEQDNSFVKPSKKTQHACYGELQSHDLAIVHKTNLKLQMKKMKKRVTVLLERY